MKKSIYSLAPLRDLLLAANRRYLEFISAIEDDRAGTDKLNKISQPAEANDRSYRGFNFFDPQDEELFPIPGQRRVQHQRLSEQRSAPAREEQKHGANLPSHETAANPRSHQKDWKNLQVLPHGSGQASHRSRTQTQKPLHHSRIVSGCILKVLPDSAKTC